MSSSRFPVDIVPVLSRGRHRSPRSGACFMEYASYLAGERWSDHPACTHPALSALARLVNDWTSDAARSRLAPMIPSVIGVAPGHPAVEVVLAIRAAAEAIPVASEERQRLLAVGLLRTTEHLAEIAPDRFERHAAVARSALDQVPYAEQWARRYLESLHPPRIRSATSVCDAAIAIAVAGIGEACVADTDERLNRLLAIAISELGDLHVASAGPSPAPSPGRPPIDAAVSGRRQVSA